MICKTFLNRPSVFFACQILSEMLKDVLQKRGGDDDQKKIVRIICSWNSFLCQTWNLCISCCHHGRWTRTRATLTIGQVLASNHWRRHTSSTIGIFESNLIKISFWSRGLYNQLVCVGQQSRRGSGDLRSSDITSNTYYGHIQLAAVKLINLENQQCHSWALLLFCLRLRARLN